MRIARFEWIIGGDPAARQSAVAAWARLPAASRPDFASVNLSEAGWVELCGVLASAGIAAEAGIWSVADARIGLEDTIVGPDGSPVSGNAELVRLALQIWRASAAP